MWRGVATLARMRKISIHSARRRAVRRSAALVSAIALLAAGCSPHKYLDPQTLSDHLVTITDLPTGWSETQRQAFETRSNENPSIDPSVWCSEATAAAVPLITLADGDGADVEMQFAKTGAGGRMMRLQAWSNSNVKQYFETLLEVVRMCDGKKRTDTDGTVTQTDIITGKSIGDESVSWTDVVTPPAAQSGDKLESVGRTTVARFHNVIMVLQIGDAGPAGSSQLLNETDWWDIVTRAATKLESVA